MRRLSGGNQQKVTIARWVAGGVRTMLCFDPTRGIDIRTKAQIYVLLRDLAEAGAAVLLYTSELKEVQLVCDRAIVIFGGRMVAEIDAADADEPTLLRAAYNLRSDARACRTTSPPPAARQGRRGSRGGATPRPGRRTRLAGSMPDERDGAPVGVARARPIDAMRLVGARQQLDAGPASASSPCFSSSPSSSSRPTALTALQGLAISMLPLALAAVAQAFVVIAGRDRPLDRAR